MAIDSELIVIGGGIAGTVASLSAARAGADVRLVTHKQSTLPQASGLIDVLGYTSSTDGPVVDPFEHLEDLPADHPYRRVGPTGVRDGLALFDDVVGDRYYGAHTDRNALVPTHGGTVKPTARYPAATADGLASDDRDALLVGFTRMAEFDAPLAARHLASAGVPFDVRGVTVEFPGGFRDDAKVTRYAHALDHDEPTGDGRGTVDALADAVDAHLDGESRVGFPAVLGDDRAPTVRERLSTLLGVDVFEVPMGSPSLLGLRLEDDLYAALDAGGVAVASGNPVVGAETEDGRIDRVIVDRNGQAIPYGAEEYVLATGGLVGKGIDSDREAVTEPIFDCYVAHPDDRYEWSEEEAFGDHAFARFGVSVDEDLRPLDADGRPEYENLRAAGSVLGGHDFASEKSGAGVSLATGTVAGRLAATDHGEIR
ncbi:MAG: glycerol-3-phosphate dehydrogenase subunit GlpB [Halanaeroarchaeum sp.]